jgi:hypothetical protein
MNLQSAPINVGVAILRVLTAQGRASFTEIEVAVHRWCGDVSPRRIQEVLVLLYAIGVLDYADDIDALILTQQARGTP